MRALLLWLAFLGPLQALDEGVQAAVQGMRTPALESPMRAFTDVGRPVVVFGGLLLVAAFDAAAGPATARLAIAALGAPREAVRKEDAPAVGPGRP